MNKAHQRKDSCSNADVGEAFEVLTEKYFSTQIRGLERPFVIPVGVYRPKAHRFDLGSKEGKVLIECKSHTWTAGENVPSAKMTTWDQAMLYFFLAPRSYRKIFCCKKDYSAQRGKTLCQYYLETHYHVIPDEVEFWEADEDTGEFVKTQFDMTAD